jgi:hypothetical protein
VCEVCFNVLFSVTKWGRISIMWTGTDSVKGERIVLYNFGEQRVCVRCLVMWCLVLHFGEE